MMFDIVDGEHGEKVVAITARWWLGFLVLFKEKRRLRW
jgi:hypothetical protein